MAEFLPLVTFAVATAITPGPNNIMMCKVRKKLRAFSGGEDYIQTFPGQGYRFSDPERVRQEGRFVVVAYEEQTDEEAVSVKSAA